MVMDKKRMVVRCGQIKTGGAIARDTNTASVCDQSNLPINKSCFS